MQDTLVALIVAACFGYAVWVLMPAVMRRSLAGQASRLPWPGPIARRLQKAAQVSAGCGCDGCDVKAPPSTGTSQTIRIHRRPKT